MRQPLRIPMFLGIFHSNVQHMPLESENTLDKTTRKRGRAFEAVQSRKHDGKSK